MDVFDGKIYNELEGRICMKKFWKNYKQTILLVLAMIIGAICGLIFKEDASLVKPLGDLFLNLLFIVIVPLIFFTVTTAVAKTKQPKRFGKIMVMTVIVFVVTSLIAVAAGFIGTSITDLVEPGDSKEIREMFDSEVTNDTELNVLESTVQLISVDDLSKLFSKENVVAVLLASVLVGLSIRMSKDKGESLLKVLESGKDVTFNFIKLIMYYAPIGIGCYFASFVGTFGASIALGFLKTFVLYLIIALIFYFGVYSLYAFIAGGKEGFKRFWKNILPSTFTALATCSSAACIPINIDSAKKMGVPEDVTETVIPLATNLHQDGSYIGTVFKIMFLVSLFGTNISDPSTILEMVFVTLIATLLISGVPIGGGTISEMMIITMLGYPVAALPVLTMVATVIDAPATMLNAVGDTSCSLLVARGVDGKKWLKNKD